MMCPHCFNKYKKSEVIKQTKFSMDVLQFRFKGYSDKEKYPSELKIDENTHLLGLPSNNAEMSQQFQGDLKHSIYYQIGDYASAVSTAFESFQTFLASSDSLQTEGKEDKNVLSFILLQKNQILTVSNLPTYGLAIIDNQIHSFDKQTWNPEVKTYISTFSFDKINPKNKKIQIIFGLSLLKFETKLLLSSTVDDNEQKENISFDQLYNDTQEYFSKYLKQFDGTINEKNPTCGFLISLKN